MLTRRDLLAAVGASAASGLASTGCSGDAPYVPPSPDDDASTNSDGGSLPVEADFLHGVASGDPLSDRVILWTRVTPRGGLRGFVDVRWELSATLDFATLVASGSVVTTFERDYTVKVDAAALSPGTTYYYRFAVGATHSVVGRTRTTPVGPVDRLRLAVVSCASLAHGYFHIYRDIAERLDLDAVVHLGDYIYEYANGRYGNVRPYDPPTETFSLSDYRRRHAQYKRDADVRAVHQQHPMIAIWDDHEFANNTWMNGSETPPPRGVEWRDRKAAAMRAYFEWMPIREQAEGRIWRRFAFGDLADLVMLDTRLWARPMPLPGGSPGANDPRRTLLGDDQERWCFDALGGSTARWKLVGQQVRMAPLSPKYNTDTWEGFPAARDRFLQAIARMRTDDVAVLTGDIHTSWAMDLALNPFDRREYDPRTGMGSLAVELITPGVTSPSGHPPEVEETIPDILRDNPHMRYGNGSKRGFILVDVTRERLQAEWFHLPYGAVEQRERRRPTFSAAWLTRAGANHLTPGGNPTTARENPPAAAPWEPA